MKRGTKVKITGLVSDRGKTWNSLRIEYERGIVGMVEVGPDEIGCCLVRFPTVERPLDVPRELLAHTR